MTFNPETFMIVGIGIGSLFIFFGLYAAFLARKPAATRMQSAASSMVEPSIKKNLIKNPDQIPEGILKALVPEDKVERTQIQMRLAQAGFDGYNSVRNFFIFRLALSMIFPVIVLSMFAFHEFIGTSAAIDKFFTQYSYFQIMRMVAVAVAVGFYGPTIWLNGKIKDRQAKITEGFPNALDLLQIATDAGLGLDAAMTRVGQKLALICPEISEEFLIVQTEILAGRDREACLRDMGERIGIEEAQSFAGVIIQSIRYGSSVSEALNAYASEMRETRELKAQEKANKLPVQMSGVMSVLMLPALFIITLGPTIIRYLRMNE